MRYYQLPMYLLLLPVSTFGAPEIETSNGWRTIENALAKLQKAEKWELLSLDPSPTLMDRLEKWISETFIPKELRFLALYPEEADFHDWRILGSTTVTKEATRHELVAALSESIVAAVEMREYGRELFTLARVIGPVAYEMTPERLLTLGGCFQPRHGIRFQHEGKRIEFLICFESGRVGVWTFLSTAKWNRL